MLEVNLARAFTITVIIVMIMAIIIIIASDTAKARQQPAMEKNAHAHGNNTLDYSTLFTAIIIPGHHSLPRLLLLNL